MNVVLWIIAVALAAVFLLAGVMKLTRSRAQLAELGLGWVEDVDPTLIKVVAALEVLAAVGLVLPPLVGVAPVLAPLAALGLVVVMAGAVVVHLRRREAPLVVVNLVLLLLAAIVAWGRFGATPFSA